MSTELYLQYHNIEAQGTLPHPWTTQPLRVQIYTKVASAKQASGRVMLLTGLGTPRQYFLWSTFTIDRCQQKPDGTIHLEGPGWQLAPPARLTGSAFTTFKAACANFIGFRNITAMPYTRQLVQLAEEQQPPGNSTELAVALREMHKIVQDKHARHHFSAQLAQYDAPPPADLTEPTVALSVRQPHAEAILRGIKTIEYRSSATSRRGRVLLYASRISVDDVPHWMKKYGITDVKYDDLPRGVIVGSVEVYKCDGGEWYLRHPQRATKLLVPRNRPQPIWFTPF